MRLSTSPATRSPPTYPSATANGYDPVWFGVLLVILFEIGLVTSTLDMNIFVIRAQGPDIGLPDMFCGVMPFLIAPLMLIAIMFAFPQGALRLPKFLKKHTREDSRETQNLAAHRVPGPRRRGPRRAVSRQRAIVDATVEMGVKA